MLPQKITVLGLGNLLVGDEGFGIHAMQALREQIGTSTPPMSETPTSGTPRMLTVCTPYSSAASGTPVSIEWMDGGVLGMNLLPLVEDCSHLLVLDAVDARQVPGTVVEIEKDQIQLLSKAKLSEHQIAFQEVLGLALFRGHFPSYLHNVGVQPEDLALGIGLSKTVTAALPDVIERAKRVIQAWGGLDD